MRVTTSDFERRVIRAALDFANLKAIRSTGQVENLFRPLSPQEEEHLFKTIRAKDRRAFKNDQKELGEWLEEIGKGAAGAERVRSQPRLNERLRAVRLRLAFKGGRARDTLGIDGVQAAYAYALWLILNEERLVNRLNRCGAPGCGRFRLDFKGKPRKYCSEEHRRAADKLTAGERMKRWRERERKRERKKKREERKGKLETALEQISKKRKTLGVAG